MGESKPRVHRLDLESSAKLEFHGSRATAVGGSAGLPGIGQCVGLDRHVSACFGVTERGRTLSTPCCDPGCAPKSVVHCGLNVDLVRSALQGPLENLVLAQGSARRGTSRE